MTAVPNDDPAAMPALIALKEEITTAAVCGTSSMADAVGVLLEGAFDLATLHLGTKGAAEKLLAIAAAWSREVERGGEA